MQRLALNHRLLSFVLGNLVVGLQSLETKSEEAPKGVDPVASQTQAAAYSTDPIPQQPRLSGKQPDLDGSPQDEEFSPQILKKLMRPNLNISAEWQAATNEIGLASYDAGVNFPTYPIFGPPPPLINVGFAVTDIEAALLLVCPLICMKRVRVLLGCDVSTTDG